MTTRIIIARHGNTFNKGDIITRVGARTDLPLVESERGTLIGEYLKANHLFPDHIFAAPLKRTMETARLAVAALGKDIAIEPTESFREIDYGPDENKPEEEVIARIGQKALDLWNQEAIVPSGWIVNPQDIIDTWLQTAASIEKNFNGQTVMIVSSNGVIRFSPYITGDFAAFSASHDIKVGTGCLCIFEKEDGEPNWKCTAWNLKPKDWFKEQTAVSSK